MKCFEYIPIQFVMEEKQMFFFFFVKKGKIKSSFFRQKKGFFTIYTVDVFNRNVKPILYCEHNERERVKKTNNKNKNVHF